ncbi:MAG: glutaredoxin family protein [Tumebacillaceae bacterium]
MSDKTIIMYSQPSCGPCFTAKEWLQHQNLPFEVRDIRAEPKYIDELIELGVGMTPAFKIGDEVIVGFDPFAIMDAFENN